jgi:MYXO-CTERM domain-containing protein
LRRTKDKSTIIGPSRAAEPRGIFVCALVRREIMMIRACALVVGVAMASIANAQLVITEVSSTGSSNSVGSDWFELTNLGSAAVDITGWRIDDNSASLALSHPLNGVTSIGPGESVLFLETALGANIPAFRTFWGQVDSVQIGYYSGSGLGLSSGGDGVNVFDASGVVVTGVNFGAGSTTATFGFNPDTNTFGGLSVAGVYGARTSASGTEVGSPGVIPAPGAMALGVLGGLAMARRRR